MPYLQLDVTRNYSESDKKRLAAAMSQTYVRMMSVDIRRISVAIRELGAGGLWRVPETGEEPTPVSILMLDIRRGRPAELRMELAKALCQHCVDILHLQEDRLNVEFTSMTGTRCTTPRSVATVLIGSPVRRDIRGECGRRKLQTTGTAFAMAPLRRLDRLQSATSGSPASEHYSSGNSR